MSPLRTKHNAQFYHPLLSDRERRVLQWWVVALRYLSARKVRARSDRPDWIICTDAATGTAIVAAVTFNYKDFKAKETAFELIKAKAGNYWGNLFDKSNKIYGLEMLALLAKLYQPNEELRGCNVTFHIDNTNAFDAVVKNTATPTVIIAVTHLIWHRIRDLGITAWFEWVPGAKSIADLPTREADLPYKCDHSREFLNIRELFDVVRAATHALDSGRPIVAPGTF